MFDVKKVRRKVRCGCCRGKLGRLVNFVELGRRAAWEYPSAGNVITGEFGRAVAVICTKCVRQCRHPGHPPILEAVEFRGDEVVYHPVEELEEVPLTGEGVA